MSSLLIWIAEYFKPKNLPSIVFGILLSARKEIESFGGSVSAILTYFSSLFYSCLNLSSFIAAIFSRSYFFTGLSFALKPFYCRDFAAIYPDILKF